MNLRLVLSEHLLHVIDSILQILQFEHIIRLRNLFLFKFDAEAVRVTHHPVRLLLVLRQVLPRISELPDHLFHEELAVWVHVVRQLTLLLEEEHVAG